MTQEKLKNFDAALIQFREARALQPENSDLLVNEATILFYQKKFEEAKSILDEAEKLNPSEPNLHNLRSMIFFEEKNTELAKQLDQKLQGLHHQLFIEANPIPSKWALLKMGLIADDMARLPLTRLEPIHQSVIEQALHAANLNL